jgi:hypothetical protein
MIEDKDRGLYNKFSVYRTDGSSEPGKKHCGCQYLVLDITHDPFAIPAIRAYLRACVDKYPALAADLLKLVNPSALPGTFQKFGKYKEDGERISVDSGIEYEIEESQYDGHFMVLVDGFETDIEILNHESGLYDTEPITLEELKEIPGSELVWYNK